MLTSDDDGQSFGLSVPLDASAEVNGLLVNATIEAVDLRQKLLDIELRFSTGHLLQVIPVSSGYEAWTVSKGNLQYIAVGGGELAVSSNGSSND